MQRALLGNFTFTEIWPTKAEAPLRDFWPRQARVNCSSLMMSDLPSSAHVGDVVGSPRYHCFDDYDLERWLIMSLWDYVCMHVTSIVLPKAQFLLNSLLKTPNALPLMLVGSFAFIAIQWLVYDNASKRDRIDPRIAMNMEHRRGRVKKKNALLQLAHLKS